MADDTQLNDTDLLTLPEDNASSELLTLPEESNTQLLTLPEDTQTASADDDLFAGLPPLEGNSADDKGFVDNAVTLMGHSYDQTKASLAAMLVAGKYEDLSDESRNEMFNIIAGAAGHTEKPKELTEYMDVVAKEAIDVADEWEEGNYGKATIQGLDFIGSAILESVTNPKGFAYANAEQAANLALTWTPGIAMGKAGAIGGGAVAGPGGAVIGGGGGFLLGAGMGSFMVETGAQIREFIVNEGGDPTDPKQVAKALENPEIRRRMLSKASDKGLSIAAFDAAANLIGIKLLKGAKGVKSTIKRGVAAEGAQVAGAAGGEITGQKLATGKVDPAEVGHEVALELGPGGIADIALSANAAKGKGEVADKSTQSGDDAEEVIGSVDDDQATEPEELNVSRGTRGTSGTTDNTVDFDENSLDDVQKADDLSLVPKDQQGTNDNGIDFEYTDLETGEKKKPESTQDWFDAAHQVDYEKPEDNRTLDELVASHKSRDVRRGLAQLRKQQKELERPADDALTMLTRGGGINRKQAVKEGVDEQDIKKHKSGVFGRSAFPKEGGMNIDDAGEYLHEYGFVGEEGGRLSKNEVLDIIFNGVNDIKTYTQEDTVSVVDAKHQLESIQPLIDQGEARLKDFSDYKKLKEKYGQDVADYMYNSRRDADSQDEVSGGYDEWAISDSDLNEQQNVYNEYVQSLDGKEAERQQAESDALYALSDMAEKVIGEDAVNELIDAVGGAGVDTADIARALYEVIDSEGIKDAKRQENRQEQGESDSDARPTSTPESKQAEQAKPKRAKSDSLKKKKLIEKAAHEAATSPKNNHPEPSQEQKEAGNYKLGHANVQGLDVSIENPKGSNRTGIDPDGNEWSVKMNHHYGYIKGTIGNDKDHLDVFIGDEAHIENTPVFIVDQLNHKNNFDEHKILLGFPNVEDAEKGYLDNYEKGWDRYDDISQLTIEQFKNWLKEGDTTKPYVLEKNKKSNVKPGYKRYSITVDGREISYDYQDATMGTSGDSQMAHFEFNSELVSETGYKSHFVNSLQVKEHGGHKKAAEFFAETWMKENGEISTKKSVRKKANSLKKKKLAEKRPERRRNNAARELYENLSKEELIDQVLKHELTGIDGRKAFVVDIQDAERVASIDADSLKWVNDNMSPDHGDALLQAVADALIAETDFAYHISGDEFYILNFKGGSEKQLQDILAKVDEKLSKAVITATKDDETIITLNGLNITYGIGETKDEADQKLKAEKISREERGERASRGEQPPGATIETAEGSEAEGDATEVETTNSVETGSKSVKEKSVKSKTTPESDISDDVKSKSLAEKRELLTDAEIKSASRKQIEQALNEIRDDFYRGLKPVGKDVIRKYDNTGEINLDDAREEVLTQHRDYWVKRKAEGMQADEDFTQRMDKLYSGKSIPELETILDEMSGSINSLQAAGKNEFNGNGGRSTKAATSNEASRQKGQERFDLERYIREREVEGYKKPKTFVASHVSETGDFYMHVKDNVYIDDFGEFSTENNIPGLLPISEKDKSKLASIDEESANTILDAANVTGKDRLEAISKLRSGEYKLDDIRAAYPADVTQSEDDKVDKDSTESNSKFTKVVNKPDSKEKGMKGGPYTIDYHRDIMAAAGEGKLSIDDFKTAVKALTDNKDEIVKRLNKYTKPKLKAIARQSYFRDEKKDRILKDAYEALVADYTLHKEIPPMTGFVIGSGGYEALEEKQRQDIADLIDGIEQADLTEYAKISAEKKAENEKLKAEAEAAIADPETIEDFYLFINTKVRNTEGLSREDAYMMLSPGQRETFDSLVAEQSRDERKARADQQKTTVQVAGELTGAKLVETKHTRDGYDLFVVVPDDRVSKEDYRTWLSAAKKMGGWYSRYRGQGATPGFQFKEKDSAETFLNFIVGGDTEGVKEKAQERRDAYVDDKSQSAVERLNEMADKLEAKSEESLNTDRKTNTHRRAGMAARAEANANYDIAIAKTMRKVADGVDSGKIKFLDRVRTKAQVEMLQQMVINAKTEQLNKKFPDYGEREKHAGEAVDNETIDHATFPRYTAYRSDLARLGRQMLEISGMKQRGQKILKVADDTSKEYNEFAKENLNDVGVFFNKDGERAVFKRKGDAAESIIRSGFRGQATVLPFKRGENLIILSSSEAIKRGIWDGDNDKRITLNGAFMSDLVGRARRNNRIDVPWQFENVYEKRTRLSSMGIETPTEFRAMLREFIGLREEQAKPDKVKELERSMVGRVKDGLDFFPTPEATADEMVEVAGIEEGMSVLEPSAGWGHIAERIREAGVEPDVIEMGGKRQELLEAKGFNVVGNDFIAFSGKSGTQVEIDEISQELIDLSEKFVEESNNGDRRSRLRAIDDKKQSLAERRDTLRKIVKEEKHAQYDRIVMNPPFSENRDVQHVQHAYSLLKPKGRLVAIMGEHAFFAKDKKSVEFREWLESVGGSEEKLEPGTFQDPSLPVNTSVNARMVVIDKGEPLYSRHTLEQNSKGPTGLSRKTAQAAIDEFKSEHNGYPQGIEFRVYKNKETAFGADEVERLRKEDGVTRIGGAYYGNTGKVILIASDLHNKQDALSTIRHELLAHHGLNLFLQADKQKIIDRIKQSRGERSLKKLWDEMDNDYQGQSEDTKAEELLARIAEHKPSRISKLWNDLVQMIRNFLIEKGWLTDKTTKGELTQLIQSISESISRGATQSNYPESDLHTGLEKPQFDESASPIFYSQLHRVLADKLPNKGIGSTFNKTIQAYAKKGEFKKEELEWSGLEDWLKSQAMNKVTKADVLDFITANQIKVTEVEKGGTGGSGLAGEIERLKSSLQMSGIRTSVDFEGNITGVYVRDSGIALFINDDENNGLFPDYDPEYGVALQDVDLDKDLLKEVLAEGGVASNDQIEKDVTDLFEVVSEQKYNESIDELDSGDTKYQDWQLPGGENYTELLLTMPEKFTESYSVTSREDNKIKTINYGNRKQDAEAKLAELKASGIESNIKKYDSGHPEPVYHSNHWQEPNILAHVRYNERIDADGKRVLFIEETQSDWHQEGRKKGYKNSNVTRDYAKATFGISDSDWSKMSGSDKDAYVDEIKEGGDHLKDMVPNAPLKTTWPMFVMKRMIRHAVENGFDRVAWTTGDQQNERYNIGRKVRSISWYKNKNNLNKNISIDTKDDGYISIVVDENGLTNSGWDEFHNKDLSNVIGKNLSLKIMSNDSGQLRDQDLRVGGSGMEGFYDNMLPKMVNKYVKKWGAKVGQTGLGLHKVDRSKVEVLTKDEAVAKYGWLPENVSNYAVISNNTHLAGFDTRKDAENYIQKSKFNQSLEPFVHSLDITGKMRDSVMDGQPLFSRKAEKNHVERRSHDRSFMEEFKYQPIDHVFRKLFEIARVPKVTQAAMNQVEKTVVDRKFDSEGRFAFLNPVIESTRAGIIDRYGLSDEFKKRDHQRETQKRAITREGFEFIKQMMDGGMTTDEAKIFKAMLEGDEIPESRWNLLSAPVRQSLDDMGHELVELGWLDAETYDRHRGKWIHRVYVKHESDQTSVHKWVSNLLKKRRAKMYGSQLKRRGIDLYVDQEALIKTAPQDWWGKQLTRKGDKQLIGKKFTIFDRMSHVGQGTETFDSMEEGGTKPKIQERVYWPADMKAPAKYQAWENKGTFEVRGFNKGKVDLWRDYSKSERESMGEIMDSRYILAKTYSMLANDLSTARFYSDIAKHPDWTWHLKGEPDPATVTDPRGALATYTGYEWVKVPNARIPGTTKKAWGPLAGKYVRAEIYRDLHELDQMGKRGFWKKALTQWKLNKTARNPVVHMNNVMSNMIFMDLADIRWKDLVAGIHEMRTQGENYKEAELHGMFGSTFIDHEIREQVMNPILDELISQNQNKGEGAIDRLSSLGRFSDTIIRNLKKADAALVNAYGFEDELFRMATYMRKRHQGFSAEEAAMFGRDQFLNYDIRAPWVNAVRGTVLPFIAYSYRAVPLIANAIAERPWKLAKYATLAYMAESMAYLLSPGDEEEERKSMRDQEQGKTWIGVPRMLRMPWRDQHGNPVFLDIRRWIPAGDVFDTNQGQSPLPIPAPLQFGGPMMLAAEIMLNKQAFTGKEIINPETDTKMEQAGKIGGWAWRSWMPAAPWIPESWYWQKIERSLRGGRDQLGHEYGLGYAMSSSMGVKLKPHDVDLGYNYLMKDVKRMQNDLKYQLRRAMSDYQRKIIDKDELNKQRKIIENKQKRLNERAKERFKKAG